MLVCDHYRVSRGKSNVFEEGKHQLKGSTFQVEHRRSHGRNNENLDLGKAKRKMTSVRATCASDRCTFAFTIFCSAAIGSEGKWYVAMTQQKVKDTLRYKHSHHLPVSDMHLTKSVTSIANDVREEILVKIRSGAPPVSIVAEIRETHKISISVHQVYSMKKQIIHDLVRSAGEDPSHSAAERLIQVFKTYTDVSYVYVRHHMQTGFVTYMKSRNSSQHIVERGITMAQQASSVEEISAWRKELKLGDSNEILVAFAWSHIEESRKLSMFPEFTAVDLTFGVNRQKRPLLVLSGVDGDNKSFTGFRCFMPSKTKQAYKWALHIALPLVNGQATVNRMQCISTDNEEALEQAIEESRHHPGGLPLHIKHRLDFYHLFLQPWNQYCSAPSYSSKEVLSALDTVKEWVYSWITNLETEAEFHNSLKKYNAYFETMKTDIGDHLSKEIEKVVGRVISNIEKVGSYMFQRTATMGFISSSIVEGTNVGIKRGVHAAKANMNIDMSGTQMLQQVDTYSHRRNQQLASGIHRNKSWSSSLTRDTLTKYQEGLAVKNYDIRDTYWVIQQSEKLWYVANKSAINHLLNFNEHGGPIHLVCQYYHIRKVQIDQDGFMNCSCPYCYQYLAPCRHIMAVLDHTDAVVPELFHLRWWQVFHYYYLTEFGKSVVPDLHDALDKTFTNLSMTHFTRDGQYRGCLVGHAAMMDSARFILEEKVKVMIMTMTEFTDTIGPIDAFGTEYMKYFNSKNYLQLDSPFVTEMDVADNTSDDEEVFDSHGFGGLSQTVSVMSPNRRLPHFMHGNKMCSNASLKDTENYHLFMSLNEAAKTPEQCEMLRTMMIEMTNRFLAQNRKSQISNDETTFLGEDGSGGHRTGKRHKQQHERWKR
jgi:hypothetical protein